MLRGPMRGLVQRSRVSALEPPPGLVDATTEDAELYRRIMRVLYLHHQSFGLRLRPPQVADGVRERYGIELEPERVEERLAKLVEWGAIERDHDAALAT